MTFVAGAAGVFLFYVQHQFEDTYCTTVHHLSARVPNYNLQRAHDELDVFRGVPAISLWDGLRATRLKVWCPERGRLLRSRELHDR